MTLEIDSAASAEAEEAALWYEEQRSGLGVEFLAEIDQALATIAETPHMWPSWPDLPLMSKVTVRRYLVRRFPSAIAYQIHQGHVVILAVVHTARRPGYWL